MKINKNIITTILVSVLFFSTSKIASADTFNITYKTSNNNYDFVTTVVDYGLNKRTYKQGEVVQPAGNAYAFSLRCLNAGDVNASLKAVFSNFEIGNPGSSYSTYTKTELSGPTSYISNESIYINGALAAQMVDYLDSSHYTETYIPSYGYRDLPRTIDISSITRVEIGSNGDAYASIYNYAEKWEDMNNYNGSGYSYQMIAPAESGYRPYKVATGLLQAYQSGIRTLERNNPTRTFTNFTDTRSILMRSGTLVYGSLSLPGSVTIPSNATPGTYVAQVDFNPGWNGFPSPRKSLTTGAWNTKTCWDGSQVLQSQDCPVQLYNCPDGQRLAVCTTQRCWDGSIIPTSQNCPSQPAQTKTCQNGSVVNINETCYKTCSNGQTIPESQTCPKKLLPPIDQDCSDPNTPCEMLYFFEKFFNIKRASAIIAPQEMEVYEMNGGGGYSGGGTYTTPASCGSSWWCTITLSAVTISQPFEVISTNQAPTVQIK